MSKASISSNGQSTDSSATTSFPSTANPASQLPVKSLSSLTPLAKQPKGILVKPSATQSPDLSSSSPGSSAVGTNNNSIPPSLNIAEGDNSQSIESPTNSNNNNNNTSASSTPTVATAPHPLHRSWTFTYSLPKPGGGWEEAAITSIVDVSTIEQFWGAFNSLTKPTSLPPRSDLHFFQSGVSPTWEDPANVNGGRWQIEYKKNEEEMFLQSWVNSLLALIGEQFTDGDEVMGVVLNIRKNRRIQLWTRSTTAATKRAGVEWKDFVGYKQKIGFVSFADCKKAKPGVDIADIYTV